MVGLGWSVLVITYFFGDAEEVSHCFFISVSKKKIKEDEEKWLEALDKGELDDHGEIKKEKDIGMMTVRQVS